MNLNCLQKTPVVLSSLMCVLLLCTGCGGSGVIVQGQLVQEGKPLTISDKGLIIMNATHESTQKKAVANVGKDGSFTLGDGKGGGIPPGSYSITIEWFDPYTGQQSDRDKLGGKFSEKGTPIKRTIEPGQQPITIDLSKPQGS